MDAVRIGNSVPVYDDYSVQVGAIGQYYSRSCQSRFGVFFAVGSGPLQFRLYLQRRNDGVEQTLNYNGFVSDGTEYATPLLYAPQPNSGWACNTFLTSAEWSSTYTTGYLN